MTVILTILLALTYLTFTANAFTLLNQVDRDWEIFKQRHNKNYDTPSEERARKQIYLKRREEISKHNEDYEKGLETFSLDLNQFSDMNPNEVHGPLHLMLGEHIPLKSRSIKSSIADSVEALPKSVDWRTEGAVTPVKNQKTCASCYAFATTGSLEGQIFRKFGVLQSLSEQNLVDCTYRLGTTGGCEGGNVPAAMKYAMVFGVDTEESYPYMASAGRCKRKVAAVGPKTKIIEYQQIRPPSEAALMSAVANIGPIASCFQIGPKFDSYKTGVFYEDDNTGDDDYGHCALVVGYGTSNDGQDYWLVKNSMGSEQYGENGYIRMARNKDNMFGIASYAYYPVI